MSQEIREKALDAAVKAGGDGAMIVQNAAMFADYIAGNDKAEAPATKKSAKAAVITPVAAIPAAQPAKTPKKVASDPIADMKKVVGDKVNELLKANKRSEAVELLASFNGAKSATGVIEQGEEVVQAFLVGADAILMAE